MSSYGLIQGYFGIHYDAVDKMLYLGAGTEEDFEVFLSTAFGYGTAGIRNRRPFVTPVRGEIPVAAFVYNGETILDGAS